MRAPKLLIPVLAALLAACSPSDKTQAQTANLPAPTRRAPTDAASLKVSFAPVVKKAAPAVVNISAKRIVRQQADPFWEMFGMGAPRSSVQGSLGSGVIVREDGVIVTNNHVIEEGQEITVSLSDRREFPAKVLLADPRTDLAVLKIDVGAEKLPTLAIADSADIQVGDLVLAIGDPFGVGQTVTNGIVSAVNRSFDGQDGSGSYLQTDAAINPGNSGGALVDMDGDLIGLNSFIVSRSGGSVGVGFAIPASLVRRVVETAAGGGHALVRPWLGARGQAVTADIARSLGLAAPHGVMIAEIWPGSAADRAGLKTGDIVLAVGGQAVEDEAGLTYAVGARRPGETLALTVRRDGAQRTVNAAAEAPPATPARDERTLAGVGPFAGATVVNFSPALADEIGVDPFFGKGVMVLRVGQGPAAQVGLRPGDFVREVNGKTISAVSDLAAAAATNDSLWTVTIERDGQRVTARFQT